MTATQLGTYDHAKQVIASKTGRDDMTAHALASALAGFACSATSAPVDVIKVRIMKDTTYSSPLVCAIDIVKKEGILSLYKGFSMCCAFQQLSRAVMSSNMCDSRSSVAPHSH